MSTEAQSHPNIALLAPVPEGPLLEGRRVCEAKGKVAFGSRAWEVFRSLDTMREGMPVDVYMYASHAGSLEKVVSWQGRYVRHVEGVDGKHPDGRKFRSRLALEDGSGWWAVFWEVEGLHPIAHISTADLRGYKADKDYGMPFVPEGPIIIEHPL